MRTESRNFPTFASPSHDSHPYLTPHMALYRFYNVAARGFHLKLAALPLVSTQSSDAGSVAVSYPLPDA